MPIRRFARQTRAGHQARVTGGRQGRLEMLPAQMLDQVESHHALEHGDFNKRALPRGMALQQGRHDAHRHHQAAGFVSRQRRKKPRGAGLLGHHRDVARHALDDVVVGGPAAIRAALAKAVQPGVNQARASLAQGVGVEPDARQFLRPHIVHEDVCAANQMQQGGLAIGFFDVDHHRLFIAIHAQKQR